MSTSASEPVLLVDASVAIALALRDHDHHETTFEALGERRLGLSGHAAFETFSVLTRLPAPARRTAATVARLLAANFPDSRFLSAEGSTALLAGLQRSGIAGGAIYDALVGATAAEHGLVLATRDRRALETYRRLGVATELLA
jgi:predicted nucleic acid-binding protein